MIKKKTRTQQLVDNCRDIRDERNRSEPSLLPCFERRARELSAPVNPPEIRCGEVVPSGAENRMIIDTLNNPDTIAVDASLERTDLLQRVGALEMGLDAAQSINACNSFEKMLAHQLAACHVAAMRIFAEVAERPNPHGEHAQMLQVKKMNLAARLMDVYQKGMDTLTRTRTAGRQTITVKQVHVTGGQNVITDTVTTRGRERGADE